MIAPASRRIGKYEIVRKLGRGGMADVYLAQDTESGDTVALKIIEHGPDADTRDAIAAEMRGAVLQERLAAIDPRVVRVFDAGDLDGYFFVAMEYIDGQDLAELMQGRRLEPEFAVDTALEVARTLEHAHHLEVTIDGKDFHGIVHGDIKPKNIRIDARGGVRVLDFGIAKALSLSRRLTRNEFGSVPYASPERLDTGEVNVGSDLWSLAVMLYEMITGLKPYEADSTEKLERMIRSRVAPPPAPDPCPEALRRILIKAMAPAADVRYQSAQKLEEDLANFRSGQPVRAESEDLDATRRTTPREAPDDETRRTAPPAAALAGAAAPKAGAGASPSVQQHGDTFYWMMRGVVVLVLASVGYLLYGAVSGYSLYRRGLQLQHDVAAEQITDAGQIWDRWTDLADGNPGSFLLRAPRSAVKQKFVEAADHVIDTYRENETQPIYEADWQRAHTMLLHALSADPEDKVVRGKLRLTEGHLLRINGGAHSSAAELNQAVGKFTEAQQMMPSSQDPALGLARVYIYGLKDLDRASQAFQDAVNRGYKLGPREKSQLADGYRARADRLWWDSRKVRGLPQEKEQIDLAAADYRKALDLYQESGDYGKSRARIQEIMNSLDSVTFRLQEIESAKNEDGGLGRAPRVAGAIIGLIEALKDKAIQRKGTAR